MNPEQRRSKHRPKRRNSSMILILAAITGLIAAIAVRHACQGPTSPNLVWATSTSAATAAEFSLVPYTRRNEQKAAHYRSVVQQMMSKGESPVE